MRYVLKSGERADTHICEPGRRRTNISVKNIAGTAPRVGTASEGIMVESDEEVAALRAKMEREKKDLERIRREKEAMQAKLEKAKRELKKSKSEREIRKRE